MYEAYARLRDARGLSDYQVCQETGIAPSTISSWKSGLYTPKVDKMVRIAKLFGVSLDELLEVDDAIPKA